MTRRERSAGSFSRETLVEVRVYLAVEKNSLTEQANVGQKANLDHSEG
jgi:hypothetical protein